MSIFTTEWYDKIQCECLEMSMFCDMTKCEVCEKTKCVDCFTMDEDSEICDKCATNLRIIL